MSGFAAAGRSSNPRPSPWQGDVVLGSRPRQPLGRGQHRAFIANGLCCHLAYAAAWLRTRSTRFPSATLTSARWRPHVGPRTGFWIRTRWSVGPPMSVICSHVAPFADSHLAV